MVGSSVFHIIFTESAVAFFKNTGEVNASQVFSKTLSGIPEQSWLYPRSKGQTQRVIFRPNAAFGVE